VVKGKRGPVVDRKKTRGGGEERGASAKGGGLQCGLTGDKGKNPAKKTDPGHPKITQLPGS